MTYANQRKAKIAVKGATLWHDVLSIAREASAAPAATFKQRNRRLEIHRERQPVTWTRTAQIRTCEVKPLLARRDYSECGSFFTLRPGW
jgi:hypothetical protein